MRKKTIKKLSKLLFDQLLVSRFGSKIGQGDAGVWWYEIIDRADGYKCVKKLTTRNSKNEMKRIVDKMNDEHRSYELELERYILNGHEPQYT